MNKEKVVIIYADGACKGNPGPGGWGVHLQWGDVTKQMCGGEHNTTNNRMELLSIINGLKLIKRKCSIVIRMDSQYVIKGMTEWKTNWIKNNWIGTNRKPVKNKELWQELIELAEGHDIVWEWVKGHSNDCGNDLADSLANQGINNLK